MQNIRRVIVPIDKSDASKVATKQGAYLAKSLGIDIVILSIDNSQEFIASAILEEKLQNENQQILNEFKIIAESEQANVYTEIVKGTNPAEEIVKFSNDDDLIVMASHNRKGLDRFVIGSVSEEVLHCATCAVMILKPDLSKKYHNL